MQFDAEVWASRVKRHTRNMPTATEDRRTKEDTHLLCVGGFEQLSVEGKEHV